MKSLEDATTLTKAFQLIAITPPGVLDPTIAIAASRAEAIGIFNLEFANDPEAALAAINRLGMNARYPCGIKLDAGNSSFNDALIPNLPEGIGIVILIYSNPVEVTRYVQKLRMHSRLIFLEALSIEHARHGHDLGVDGIVAKGNEAAGIVGEKTAFILFQQIVSELPLPVWVQGGIGLHTAAACCAGGASGVVLDSQLYLMKESPFPESVKKHIRRLDGSETICVGESSHYIRIYNRPGMKTDGKLFNKEQKSEDTGNPALHSLPLLRSAIRENIAWDENMHSMWLLGQDVAFAGHFALRFGTIGLLFQAIRKAVNEHISSAQKLKILDEGAPLALSHNTRYPIVQGPMARVSDRAGFLTQVAEGGALPCLALSNLKGEGLKGILEEVSEALKDKPWGIGILGFGDNGLFESQMEAVSLCKPPYAILAGGMPNQAEALESKGIKTYVHVQSSSILEMFIDRGFRRFIFEGRECGGHIGPRSSFVLWEVMIDKILEKAQGNSEPEKYHILFAGGIHDALSAAMIACMASPLARQGIRVGVLMGTAYLFTREIVEAGAILKGFQKNALQCSETYIVESGPGHAIRCCKTPFVGLFDNEKQRLASEKISREAASSALEKMIMGRLRIASKGLMRNPAYRAQSDIPYLVAVDEEKQEKEGLYMIGQIAALRDKVCTIEDLHRDVSVNSLQILHALSSLNERVHVETPVDIAIIGMSCVFPKAVHLQAFWKNILEKKNAISEVPPNRWDWKLYFDKDKKVKDKIYSRWGGFLDDIPFDPMKYGIPPNSLHSIEPLHLMALEVVDAALKDAGYAERAFPREKTSVIFGTGSGYGELGQKYIFRSMLPMFLQNTAEDILEKLPEWTEDSFPGILMNVLAGRIANRFNLGGINYTLDAACASSLAALYDAVRELETGSSDMVVVGGADAGQNPFGFLCFSKTQALSQLGSCRVFDEKADGTVISEGLAVLVLKRLADAERDNDHIYAVIKAVKGASDGRGQSMTAPRIEGQVAALRRTYEKAGFSAATVELFEAHGTGTVVGDQVEAESVSRFLKESGASRQSCAIGSVKSMIGHTKGAAGIAGVIKAALALYHKVLPPTIGVEKPNSRVDFLNGPIYINTELRPWIANGSHPRRAAASSFGFGGTNFHTVLEEYEHSAVSTETGITKAQDVWPAELFLWAGNSTDEFTSHLNIVKGYLEKAAAPSLGDVAFTVYESFNQQTAKNNVLPYRLAIVASSPDDLREKIVSVLGSLLNPECDAISDPRGIYFGRKKMNEAEGVAFLFPGQGSQYVNMLRELTLYFPELRTSCEKANSILKGRFPEGLSGYVFPPPAFTSDEENEQMKRLTRTDIAQSSLGAACYGMFSLLRNLHLNPDMTAGHSYGEYAALCASGVFDEETLYAVSEARGRLILKATEGGDLGTMAAVKAGVKVLGETLKDDSDVVVANINSPVQTVISGEKTAIEKTVVFLKSRGIQAQVIPVAGAFHSHFVEPAREIFAEFLDTLHFAAPEVPVFSNTFVTPYKKTAKDIRGCLARHMVMPVRFMDEIEAMYNGGARIFIEVGPGSVLTNLTRQILEGKECMCVSTDVRGNSGLFHFFNTLAQLSVYGVPFSAERLFNGRNLKHIDFKSSDEQSGDKMSPTTWLVNGSSIRPAFQAAKKTSREVQTGEKETMISKGPCREQKTDVQADASRQRNMQEISVPGIDLPARTQYKPVRRLTADNSGTNAVMLQYQQLMQRFLEMQERVMMTYLSGERLPGVPPSPVASERHPGESENREIVRTDVPVEPCISRESEPVQKDSAPAEEPAIPTEKAIRVPEQLSREDLKKKLLAVTSDRTGYPADMLNPDSDLEADLGIDSIKRVEILGAFIKSFPESERQKVQKSVDELSRLKTLALIVEKTAGILSLAQNVASSGTGADASVQEPVVQSPNRSGADEDVPRFVIETVEATLPEKNLSLSGGEVFIITADRSGISEILGKELTGLGAKVVFLKTGSHEIKSAGNTYFADLTDPDTVKTLTGDIRQKYGAVSGLIHLAPLGNSISMTRADLKEWKHYLNGEVKSLFYLLRSFAKDLRNAGERKDGWVIACASTGDHLTENGACFAGQGGIAGLMKTIAYEWPGVTCRMIEMDFNNPSSRLPELILREMAAQDSPVEVKYNAETRLIYRAKSAPLAHNGATSDNIQINRESVIIVTGGAVGITAEVAYELAVKYQPTLILAGRSALPEEEPQDTAGLTSTDSIREVLIKKYTDTAMKPNPVMIEKALVRLMKDREIVQNISRMKTAGATVHYFQTDVRDEQKFGKLVDEIYSSFGRIDGVIHGSGVIEDKLLEDKTDDSFNRVFDTKADSAFILSQRLKPEGLKFIVFFTSVAGRFGNRGQSDYAAANEVVNRLAVYLDKFWEARVVAINWGPWKKTGMVTPELEKKFREKAIQLVPPSTGSRMLEQEIRLGDKGDSEIVIGRGPWEMTGAGGNARTDIHPSATMKISAGPLPVKNTLQIQKNREFTLEHVFTLSRHPYMRDHRLDGKPVLPVAGAAEWIAQFLQSVWPEKFVTEIHNLKVLRGLILDDDEERRVLFSARSLQSKAEEPIKVTAEIVDAETSRPYYRASAILRSFVEEPPQAEINPLNWGEPIHIDTAYREYLFHGELFRLITAIDKYNELGIDAVVKRSEPSLWLNGEKIKKTKGHLKMLPQWVFDPGLVDTAPQLAIVWSRLQRGTTALPSNIGTLIRYGSSGLHSPLKLFFRIKPDDDCNTVIYDAVFVDAQGKMRLHMKNVESTCNVGLNRLALIR
jgi:acyl transferase domain-containing protein/NAD(P)H-dependent flavin oxidoreductase YrpB (nitropropane dioxygenase family)/NAD(P)-dependent dehydrogenase (short-subunit alcohol dehydrogenase family)